MKVRAIKEGFYANKRRKAGQVFEVQEVKGLKLNKLDMKLVPHVFTIKEQLAKWMEPLEAMNEETQEIKPAVGASRKPRAMSQKLEPLKVTDLDVI